MNTVQKSYIFHISLAIFTVTGFVLIILATYTYGIGLTPDSSVYLSVAKNLSEGKGFVDFNGNPLIIKPPLYSLILALLTKVSGTDVFVTARLFNAVLYGVIIFLSGIFLRHELDIPLWGEVVGTMAVLCSIPIFRMSVMAWTEPLFIVCILLVLRYVTKYLQMHDKASFFMFSIAASLAMLTRYLGITVILSGGILLLFFDRRPFQKRIFPLFWFSVIAIVPCGIWVVRNYIISHTLTGPHPSTIFTFSQNVTFIFRVLLNWFFPKELTIHRSVLILLSGSIGFGLGLIKKHQFPLKKMLSRIIPVGVFAGVYIIFLLLISTIVRNEPINNRYLSPVFVPCLWMLVYFGTQLIRLLEEEKQKMLTYWFGGVLIFMIIIFPASVMRNRIVNWRQKGPGGYTTPVWKESKTVQYLQQNSSQNLRPLFSNNPYGAYLLADVSAKQSPMKTWYNSPDIKDDLNQLKGLWPNVPQAYLVWFHTSVPDYLYTVEELRTIAELSPMIELNDGTIYTISPKQL